MLTTTMDGITILLRQGKYQKVIDELMSSESEQYDKRQTYFLVGEAYRSLGKLHESKLFLEVAYRLGGESDPTLTYALGRIYHLNGLLDDAEKVLKKVDKKHDAYIYAQLRLGMISAAKGDYLRSIRYYMEALSYLRLIKRHHITLPLLEYFTKPFEDTDNVRMLISILANAVGESYRELGQIEQAKKWFSESIFSKPLGEPYYDPYYNYDRLMDMYAA